MKRIYLCVLLLFVVGLSCSEHEMLFPVGGTATRPGDGTRAAVPVITNSSSAFEFTIAAKGGRTEFDENVIMKCDSISYSIVVGEYRSGSCKILLTDTSGQPIAVDSIFCDTAFTKPDVIGKVPGRIVVELDGFAGILSIDLIKRNLGTKPEIFGLWNWEYEEICGFSGCSFYRSSANKRVMLRFGRDSILTAYANDTLVYRYAYSIRDRDNMLSVRYPMNPVWLGAIGFPGYIQEISFPTSDTLFMDMFPIPQLVYSRIPLQELDAVRNR